MELGCVKSTRKLGLSHNENDADFRLIQLPRILREIDLRYFHARPRVTLARDTLHSIMLTSAETSLSAAYRVKCLTKFILCNTWTDAAYK